VSKNKTKDKGTARKSGKDTKKKISLKKSKNPPTTKKPTTRKPTKARAQKPTKGPAKEPMKKDEGNEPKKPVDMVQARENVSDLVRESATGIANAVIAAAKTGQLASVKYLFEAVGLYPATGQTLEKPEEDSLAHTLLRRMGLPLEPVATDDDDAPMGSASDARGMSDESAEQRVERDDARAGCEEEQRLVEGKSR
jgi:hypothetical protein